jgi:ubiquinone/menaquinone biosynthesis C-methylase UbiE
MTTHQVPEHTSTRDAWDAIADGYDRFATPTNMRLAEEVLERVALRADERLLDVAAGAGALSIPAARLGARVLAVDLSPAMAARLAARGRSEGLDDLDVRVMDGHALDLADDSFDVAASQFGVMLFEDLPRGLRELARVTRPGGRVVLVAFGPPTAVEFLGTFLGAIEAVAPAFPGLPMDPPPLPFQVADPQVLHRRLEEAGCRDVRVEPTSHHLKVRSGREFWDWVTTSNPIGAGLVAELDESQRTEVQQVLDGMLRERATDDGTAVLNAAINVGIGIA